MLRTCIESIKRSMRPEDEIIVVANNANTNELYLGNILEDSLVNIQIVEENLGYGAAANLGANSASRDHIVFCDHDLIFCKNWIGALVDTYSSDPQIAGVSCKVINPHNYAIQDFGIAYSNYNGAHPSQDLPLNHPLVTEDRIAQTVCSGGFLISHKVFSNLGGFDQRFGTLYTDVDFCLNLKRNGLKVAACAEAVALHFGGESNRLPQRSYKNADIKADIKGHFMAKNADVLYIDLDTYYRKSVTHLTSQGYNLTRYLACNAMTVPDQDWYEDVISSEGARYYDRISYGGVVRDTEAIGLFELLGYDVLHTKVPVAYFVDRFLAIGINNYWWACREAYLDKDIIVDRNGNVLTARLAIDYGIGSSHASMLKVV